MTDWARKLAKKKPKSLCTIWCNRKLNELRDLFDYTCVFCEMSFDEGYLDFIHVKETPLSNSGEGRGKYKRTKDILDHPDCYTIGCFICHRQFDSGKRQDMIAKVVTIAEKLLTKGKILQVVEIKRTKT